jgi:hypothetical protein
MKRTRRVIEDVNDSLQEQISRLSEELSDLRRSISDNASDDTKSALRRLQQRIDGWPMTPHPGRGKVSSRCATASFKTP